ncbi:MAG TPA: sensor histidine kinase [Thermoleophilaceae bacterium]
MPDAGLAPQALLGTTTPESVARPRPASLVRAGWLRRVLGMLLLTGLYYGAAHVGYAVEFSGPVASIVWLPVGVAIAFLYLAGLGYWPGVVLGDLLVNNYITLPYGSAIAQTCGNVLEAVLAAYLMRRLIRGSPLGSVGNLLRMLAAIAAGTVLSATVGLLSLRLGGVVTTAALPRLWRTWWLGDAIGAVIIVPLAVAWYPPPGREWLKGRGVEAAAILVAIIGLSELALRTSRPLTYFVFPALIWAALRFGSRGATLALAVATGHAVWATTHYVGPFVFDSITHSVLATQLYIAVAVVSTLTLAAVVAERQQFADSLRASRARIVEAADAERRRLERNLHDGAQQRLTALAVRLGISAEQARAGEDGVPIALDRAQQELLVAIDELRDLAHGIHPPVLTRFGLATAASEIAARSSVRTEIGGLPSTRLDDTAEATAYYVLAEAMTNAQKHAHASSIRVRGSLSGGLLRIEVVDDGMGGAAEDEGLGLQGLRDRVEAIGGMLGVYSPPGRGTRIAAAIPASVIRR